MIWEQKGRARVWGLDEQTWRLRGESSRRPEGQSGKGVGNKHQWQGLRRVFRADCCFSASLFQLLAPLCSLQSAFRSMILPLGDSAAILWPSGQPPYRRFSCVFLCETLWTVPTRLPCPWDSPGKNTGVGCHALLQGIFPTQGLNPGPPHCRRILYRLSRQGSPPSILLSPQCFGKGPAIETCTVGVSHSLLK